MAMSEKINASDAPLEQQGYHSAVEIDEEVGSWRDWVGPGLAILFVVLAIVGLFLTVGGHI